MTDDGVVTSLVVEVRARWDDADRNAHVNNAAYLALIREAHDDAVQRSPDETFPAAGDWRALEITYRTPVSPGSVVSVEVRAVEGGASLRDVRYILSADGAQVADATASWTNAEPAPPPQLPLVEGELVTVTSRLVELRRVSGIWLHEVRHAAGSLAAADHTRGAFVDLGGRIRAAPRELLDDLLRGEPPVIAAAT